MIAVIIRQPHAAAGTLLLLGLLLAAGCAADRTAEAQAMAAPTDRTGPAAVVLVAGSDEEPVFDNARLALEEELRRASPAPLAVTSLSAAPDASPVAALPATLANIETAFARTAPGASACFLFATSHGSPEGMQLTPGDEVLAPARLTPFSIATAPAGLRLRSSPPASPASSPVGRFPTATASSSPRLPATAPPSAAATTSPTPISTKRSSRCCREHGAGTSSTRVSRPR